jgi:hypothetical protein
MGKIESEKGRRIKEKILPLQIIGAKAGFFIDCE